VSDVTSIQNQQLSIHDTVVIGGGVTGLVVAWRLVEAGQEVVVLDARDRVGGRLRSERHEGRCSRSVRTGEPTPHQREQRQLAPPAAMSGPSWSGQTHWLRNPSTVILVGIHGFRRDMATGLGADHVVDGSDLN
jgi:glycine/D-amino acid oxidase-like deaminating enzyme